MALTVDTTNIGHTYTVRVMTITMGSSYAYWSTSLDVTVWEYDVVIADVPPA